MRPKHTLPMPTILTIPASMRQRPSNGEVRERTGDDPRTMMVPARPREVTVPNFEKTWLSWKGCRASAGPYIIAQVKHTRNW